MNTKRVASVIGLIAAVSLTLTGCVGSPSPSTSKVSDEDRSASLLLKQVNLCVQNSTGRTLQYRIQGEAEKSGELGSGAFVCGISGTFGAGRQAEIVYFTFDTDKGDERIKFGVRNIPLELVWEFIDAGGYSYNYLDLSTGGQRTVTAKNGKNQNTSYQIWANMEGSARQLPNGEQGYLVNMRIME